MRAIYQFGKTGRLGCISHLDLQRFMQMALRRTELPVAYSQGFNPHPILSFASALAMGWSSEGELMDIKLSEPVSRAFAFQEMAKALPPDLPLYRVCLSDDRRPALMARLRYADYRITLSGESAQAVLDAVPGYLEASSVMAIRKTKSGETPTDIRPMTRILTVQPDNTLYARLELTEKATLKPDLLVSVLMMRAGIAPDAADAHIHRLGLFSTDAAGEPIELLTDGAAEV